MKSRETRFKSPLEIFIKIHLTLTLRLSLINVNKVFLLFVSTKKKQNKNLVFKMQNKCWFHSGFFIRYSCKKKQATRVQLFLFSSPPQVPSLPPSPPPSLLFLEYMNVKLSVASFAFTVLTSMSRPVTFFRFVILADFQFSCLAMSIFD